MLFRSRKKRGNSTKQLEYISDLDTAYQIIKKFDEMYLKKSTALQIVYRHNLEQIKLKNYSKVSLFFADFEKAVNELKQADAVVTERERETKLNVKSTPKKLQLHR